MNAPIAAILIVEDDPDIRTLVADLLRREGFMVEAAESAVGMDRMRARMRRSAIAEPAAPTRRFASSFIDLAARWQGNFIRSVRNGGYLFTLSVRPAS